MSKTVLTIEISEIFFIELWLHSKMGHCFGTVAMQLPLTLVLWVWTLGMRIVWNWLKSNKDSTNLNWY